MMPTGLKKLALFSFCLASLAVAPARPDFSGNYTRQSTQANESGSGAVTLRVVQTDSSVEVTRTDGDGALTNRFPLDGTEGEWTSPTGMRGTCKARFSKETLVLETSSASSRPDGRSVRLQSREDWRLSKDVKTLTIRIEVRFPDMPPEVVAMAFPNNPRTETYQRAPER
jgi:hypothetical protein